MPEVIVTFLCSLLLLLIVSYSLSYLSPFVALSDDELANMFHNSNTPNAESSFPLEQNVPEMLSKSENLSSCKYYSDSQFKENILCKAPTLSVFHLNIRSLP